MKLPGRAWLEFDVQPAKGGVTLRQTATFDPMGLSGLAFWYELFPLHELVFRGMIRNLGRAAVGVATETEHVDPPVPETTHLCIEWRLFDKRTQSHSGFGSANIHPI